MQDLQQCNSRDAFCAAFRTLYGSHGMQALSQKWLETQGCLAAYKRASALGCSMEYVAQCLEILDEFKAFRKQQRSGPLKWTTAELTKAAEALIEEHHVIPSTGWLEANGFAGFLNSIQKHEGGIEQFRLRFYGSEVSRLVSRAGLVHDSFPEVCVANCLWSRGIDVELGGYYPDAYKLMSGKKWGKYDIQFVSPSGEFADKLIKLEIWGDLGEDYAETKSKKIEFHRDDPCFLGISHQDCYHEQKLMIALEPFIGAPAVCRYQKDSDYVVSPPFRSLADQVLEKCKFVCSKIEGGLLPTTNWFKRIENYADREVFDWEPLQTWGGFPEKITQIGGIRLVRDLLGQSEQNATKWTKTSVIQGIADFYKSHQKWPGAVLNQLRKKNLLSDGETTLLRQSKRLVSALETHIGSSEDAYEQASQLLPANLRPLQVQRELPVGVRIIRQKYYRADIRKRGKKVFLGNFLTADEASRAYQVALHDRETSKS